MQIIPMFVVVIDVRTTTDNNTSCDSLIVHPHFILSNHHHGGSPSNNSLGRAFIAPTYIVTITQPEPVAEATSPALP
jgi:hypothetical protein